MERDGQLRRVTDRERFLTFALAAAEILLEVSPGGRILFAAGALRSRLGHPAEAWMGRAARDILAGADRPAFGRLLARDRMPPTRFRLADPAGTPMACAGLRLVGQEEARFCLTLSALPGSSPATTPGTPAATPGPAALRDAAELAAREGGGVLDLIELRDGDGPLTRRPAWPSGSGRPSRPPWRPTAWPGSSPAAATG